VASGDDGAPGYYGNVGINPPNPDIYCPLGGCSFTSTECGAFVITHPDYPFCVYPTGIESPACYEIYPTVTSLGLPDQFFENSGCTIVLETDVRGYPHFYSSCPCDQLQTFASQGYVFSGYTYNSSYGSNMFVAEYPASSPYVTSVGGTEFYWEGGIPTQEVAASIETGAFLVSGGGFSAFQPQISYQQEAISNWASNNADSVPPSWAFNVSARGYPDISFAAHNYLVYSPTTPTNENCPCYTILLDGTSCASPSAAGLISLVNDALLNAGQTSLGFLNYLLYQMAVDEPTAFNDITEGNNFCNRAYCFTYGYNATTGWDPVSGLGTPNFAVMYKYILSVKNLVN